MHSHLSMLRILTRTLGIWSMTRTANTERLFFPMSCCSKGQSISLFYQPILGFWHSFTSIATDLNLLFSFMLEAPEVIDQKGTFVALFTKWAFKMIFSTFCCSLSLCCFKRNGAVWLFHQLSWPKPNVQSWQKVFLMTKRDIGKIDQYNRGLLWSECFVFFLPCLWSIDKWRAASFRNKVKYKVKYLVGGRSWNELYTLKF